MKKNGKNGALLEHVPAKRTSCVVAKKCCQSQRLSVYDCILLKTSSLQMVTSVNLLGTKYNFIDARWDKNNNKLRLNIVYSIAVLLIFNLH